MMYLPSLIKRIMKHILALFLCLVTYGIAAQDLTGTALLDKAIAYHDPKGNWETFAGELKLQFTGPAMTDRVSMVTIDLPREFFNVSAVQDGKKTFREITGTQCRFTNDEGQVVNSSTYDAQCDRTVMFRNYYTYLYGLPMKLKDPGTHIDQTVTKTTFKGKEYVVLRVSYDKEVGSDRWQFYFNPETYAMEIYQFFNGEDKKTGEYILLSDEMLVNDIKMPKNRAWYYNEDDGYLGIDKLIEK